MVSNISTGLTSFNPTYNPLVYMFNSSNTNQTGFRYVVDIYESGTSTKIYEGRVAPRPTDGYGYIDVSKIIADYITWDVDLTSTTDIMADNSYYKYDVKVGEEYIESWAFADTFFSSGNQVLVSGLTSNTFSTDDQVIINQDNTSYVPPLEGLQTVYSAVSSTSFIVDVPFYTSAANTGTVRYADGRKTITRDLLTYSTQTAYNAAFSASDWITYNQADFILTGASATNQMLTNLPDNFYATSTQDLFLNAAILSSTTLTAVFSNDSGDVGNKAISGTTDYIQQIAAGPNNYGTLTYTSGTGPLVNSLTNYYDVALYSGATAVSKNYRVYIDKTCGIEDYELLFLDRKGSFASFSFPLRAETSQSGKRTTYNQQIGDLTSGKWNYSNSDAGEITTNISVSESIKLRTGYITPEMAIYFSELIYSPVTYVKIGGVYYSCVVETNSYQPQSPRLKKLNKQEVTIRLAQQNRANI
jgi:hypothetical protein